MRRLFDEEHDAFRESFQSFIAREADGEDVFAKAVEHGFASTAVPEDRGGAGIDDRRFGVVVAEELALAGRAGLGLVLATHNDVCVPALPELEAHQLAAFACGSLERVPGGLWASKVLWWDGEVLRAFDAAEADCRPSPEGIGLHDAGFADFNVDGTELVDCTGESWAADHQIILAVLALAGARYAMGLTLEYVTERKAFGVPIASFENTRHALGALSGEIESAQAFLDDVVVHDRTAARAAAAKLTATEIQARAVDLGVQLHGGYGYMTEYPISFAYTDARFLRLYGGSNEVLRGVLAHALDI